jgi:hypothetical protein
VWCSTCIIQLLYLSTLLISHFQCLSPAGEYNLRLGIIKELHPDMFATYSGRLCSNLCLLYLFFFLTKANLHGKIVIGIGTKKILLIFFSANG